MDVRSQTVTAQKIFNRRPSHINVILIQSRGVPCEKPCEGCRKLDAKSSRKPFPECRRAAGHFGGACGNCKWHDGAARCSVRDDHESVQPDEDDDLNEGASLGKGNDRGEVNNLEGELDEKEDVCSSVWSESSGGKEDDCGSAWSEYPGGKEDEVESTSPRVSEEREDDSESTWSGFSDTP